MRASRAGLVGLLLAATGGARAAAPDEQFPNVALLTHDGTRVRFYDDLIKGRVVLISFFFTSCRTICPRATANLLKVQEALGERFGRDVRMISITVDPEADTPGVLKAYAQRHGTKPGWDFVTGRRKEIDLIRTHLGVNRYGNGKNDHTGMLVYGNEATRQWAATPVMAEPDAIVRSVMRLVR